MCVLLFILSLYPSSFLAISCVFLERPRNCSDFVDDICRECDNGFALKALNFPRCKKTVCVPCGWRLKRKDPALFLKQCVKGKAELSFSKSL